MGGIGANAAGAAEGTGATTNGAADALPANPTANGDTVRHYLNTRVSGSIIAGLKKIAREQPQDPIRALGEYLIQVADSLEPQRS
jgi:COMPASS component SDC1